MTIDINNSTSDKDIKYVKVMLQGLINLVPWHLGYFSAWSRGQLSSLGGVMMLDNKFATCYKCIYANDKVYIHIQIEGRKHIYGIHIYVCKDLDWVYMAHIYVYIPI